MVSLTQAESLYLQAIELDPEFSRAYGALAVTLGRQVQFDFGAAEQDARFARAVERAETAISIDPESAHAQWALGFVNLMRRDFEGAETAVEKAVALAPNYADGWVLLAAIHSNQGIGEQALRFIQKAKRLNPLFTWNYSFNEGRARYFMGDFIQAVGLFEDALSRNNNALYARVYLIASYVRADEIEEARWQANELLVSNPDVSLERIDALAPLAEGDHKRQLLDDLRAAGLPD